MNTRVKDYQPIACGLYDEIIVQIDRQQPRRIEYRDEDGVVQQVDGRIVDIFTRDKAEYLRVRTASVQDQDGDTSTRPDEAAVIEQEIRLDRLIRVEGTSLSSESGEP